MRVGAGAAALLLLGVAADALSFRSMLRTAVRLGATDNRVTDNRGVAPLELRASPPNSTEAGSNVADLKAGAVPRTTLLQQFQRFIDDELRRENELRLLARRFIYDELQLPNATLLQQFQRFIDDEIRRENELRLLTLRFIDDELQLPSTLLEQFQRFVDDEIQRENELRLLTQQFINDEIQMPNATLSERFQRFIDDEIQRENELRLLTQQFINDEFQREQEMFAVAQRFVKRELQREEEVRANAIKVERAAAEAATKFFAGELSRAVPQLVVCTDSLACGPAGGPQLLEAVSALASGAGASMSVRRGKCESVCPRDGGIVVRATREDHLRVWTAEQPTAATIAATTPTPPTTPFGQLDEEEAKAVSRARLAQRIVEAECATEVPSCLVDALEAKLLGDVRLWRGDLASAVDLFSRAIEQTPPSVMGPGVLTAGASPQPSVPLLPQLGWAGSVWWQSHTESALTLPPRDYFDSFFELGDYASAGGMRGSLSFLRETASGVLLGNWNEATIDVDGRGRTMASGSFRLALNPAGTAFVGQRWDDQGTLLGSWEGHRIPVPTSAAEAEAPDSRKWLHDAFVGRARAQLLQLRQQGFDDDACRSVCADAASAISIWPDSTDAWLFFAEAAEHLLAHAVKKKNHLRALVQAYEQLLFLQPLKTALTTPDGHDLRSSSQHGREAAERASEAWAADPAVARETLRFKERLTELRTELAPLETPADVEGAPKKAIRR